MTRLLRRHMKPDPRECEEVRELFSGYVDGELDPDGHRRVEEHVGFCRPCRQALANLRETLRRLRGLSQAPPPGAEDAGEVGERLRRAWRNRV